MRLLNRLDLGCGNNSVENCVTIDNRISVNPNICADIRNLPIKSNSIDRIFCLQTIEHFENPYEILTEIHRVIKQKGKVFISVPNFGTYSAISDPTHKFITDLNHWNIIFRGFFNSVKADPYGVKFESVSQKWINEQLNLINDGFWDLAQGFTFTCKNKKKQYSFDYIPWFLEGKL